MCKLPVLAGTWPGCFAVGKGSTGYPTQIINITKTGYKIMKTGLKVISLPPPPEPPDYAVIYKRVIQECAIAEKPSTDWKKRFVYLALKGLPVIFSEVFSRNPENLSLSRESLKYIWAAIDLAQKKMALLTPSEFMTVFPIEKQYDGDFNYHTTMEELEKIGMNTPLGEHVKMLLFDYYNRHVMKFIRFKMRVVDQIRECRGEPPIMESFLAENGFYSKPAVRTDENGRKFVYDPVKQTAYRMRKTFPDYLSVIK